MYFSAKADMLSAEAQKDSVQLSLSTTVGQLFSWGISPIELVDILDRLRTGEAIILLPRDKYRLSSVTTVQKVVQEV